MFLRSILVACTCFLITGGLFAQPPAGKATKGTTYGAKFTNEGAIDVVALESKIGAAKEAEVKVKGKVAEVCTAMGCWLKLESANGKTMVKMKDHAYFVPLDLVGKEVIIDGIAKSTTTSVAEQRHLAEDAKKSAEEIAAITAPKKEIVLDARGILVL